MHVGEPVSERACHGHRVVAGNCGVGQIQGDVGVVLARWVVVWCVCGDLPRSRPPRKHVLDGKLDGRLISHALNTVDEVLHIVALPAKWRMDDDPPSGAEVKQLRKHVKGMLAEQEEVIASTGNASHVVGTSKTFKQLARLTGAAPSSAGPYVGRRVSLDGLRDWVPRLAAMSADSRASLPGVSQGRAAQLVAGAIVAQYVMEAVGAKTVQICPWALREGVILRRLDWMGQ